MTLKISGQLVNLIDYLRAPGTEPGGWAKLHGVSESTAREYLRRGRENYFAGMTYVAKWNSLMSNPRLRRWLKRPEDYTQEQEDADRRRQELLDGGIRLISRTKRCPSSREKRQDAAPSKGQVISCGSRKH